MPAVSPIPSYEPDLFSEEGILHPDEHYAAMRALGPIVYLPSSDIYAVSRYNECQAVLRDPDLFISRLGNALNSTVNEIAGSAANAEAASVIISDGARHSLMRSIEAEPLNPKAMTALRSRIYGEAGSLIEDLLKSGNVWHDAVKSISQYLPLTLVVELGGLPPVGRAKMLQWAAAGFDIFGPMNSRTAAGLPVFQGMLDYVTKDIDRSSVTPGSWAARAFELADTGQIPPAMARQVIADFIGPSLDTTIAGTSNLLMLLGQNRDQWERLKEEPGMIPNAINESLRLGSPIRCFSRVVREDTVLGDVALPAETRIAVFYASANRDDRKFPDAERFDIGRRNASEHLAFGSGAHQCIGNNLARLEMTAILRAMLAQLEYLEVREPDYTINNLLRSLKSIQIRLHASAGCVK